MNESLFLCKCVFCLENNSNGKLVSQSVYYQHRKKNQIILEKEQNNNEEEKNINANLKNIEISKYYNLSNCFYYFIYFIIY